MARKNLESKRGSQLVHGLTVMTETASRDSVGCVANPMDFVPAGFPVPGRRGTIRTTRLLAEGLAVIAEPAYRAGNRLRRGLFVRVKPTPRRMGTTPMTPSGWRVIPLPIRSEDRADRCRQPLPRWAMRGARRRAVT